jgi:predicted CoA-binding protein
MSKRVAVIGASNDRRKFGNRAVRAFLRLGYEVHPVNPHETEVEGLKTRASVRDVPGPLDMVTVYVPPHVGIALLDDIASVAPAELWLNPGSDDEALVEKARRLGLEPILACSITAAGESPYGT